MTTGSAPSVVDFFDLPDWIGATPCTWTTSVSLGEAWVHGQLVGSSDPAVDRLGLAVQAVDVAYPAAVVTESVRHDAHQAWVHGQVLLLDTDNGFTVGVPGTGLGVELLCEAIRRFARGVGAATDTFTVAVRL